MISAALVLALCLSSGVAARWRSRDAGGKYRVVARSGGSDDEDEPDEVSGDTGGAPMVAVTERRQRPPPRGTSRVEHL